MEKYNYATEEPFLKIKLNPAGYDLPSNVLGEIWQYTALMVEGAGTVGEVAATYEESTIYIGFTTEERIDLIDYYTADLWPNVQGGQPVAHWRSGISVGCDQYLFVMPDGHFEWTEP